MCIDEIFLCEHFNFNIFVFGFLKKMNKQALFFKILIFYLHISFYYVSLSPEDIEYFSSNFWSVFSLIIERNPSSRPREKFFR